MVEVVERGWMTKSLGWPNQARPFHHPGVSDSLLTNHGRQNIGQTSDHQN